MPVSRAFSVCQSSVAVTASGQTASDAQTSIRCQINLCDEVCESPSIRPLLRILGAFQLRGAVTQSEANTLADPVDSDGSSYAWIHTFFMNLLLKSLIMLIKDILGPTFLYPILCTIQETSLKKALHRITSTHSNELFYKLAAVVYSINRLGVCNCVKLWCGSSW